MLRQKFVTAGLLGLVQGVSASLMSASFPIREPGDRKATRSGHGQGDGPVSIGEGKALFFFHGAGAPAPPQQDFSRAAGAGSGRIPRRRGGPGWPNWQDLGQQLPGSGAHSPRRDGRGCPFTLLKKSMSARSRVRGIFICGLVQVLFQQLVKAAVNCRDPSGLSRSACCLASPNSFLLPGHS